MDFTRASFEISRKSFELLQEQTERVIDTSMVRMSHFQDEAKKNLDDWMSNAGKMYEACVDALQGTLGFGILAPDKRDKPQQSASKAAAK